MPAFSRRGRGAALAALLTALAPSSPEAAPLTAAQAAQRLAAGELEQLYLDASPLARGAHPRPEPALAQLLVQASTQALAKGDPSLALGLADLAQKLDPQRADAFVAEADAAEKLGQPAAVQEALEGALKLAPKDSALLLRAAALSEREGDLARALALFRKVPTAEGRTGAARVEAALAKRDRDRAAQQRLDDEVRAKREQATKAAQQLSDATAPASAHFRLLRGEGVQAPLDATRLDPFEKAYSQVIAAFGHAPEGHVTVRLTAEASRKCGAARTCLVAGELWLDPSAKADRALEAEAANAFTRAVIDGLAGGRAVPAWLVEGLAGWQEHKALGESVPNATESKLLGDAKRLKAIPRLAALQSFEALGAGRPLAQAKSVLAVEALVRANGAALKSVAHLLVRMGGGASLEEAFAAELGPGRLARLDGEAEALLR